MGWEGGFPGVWMGKKQGNPRGKGGNGVRVLMLVVLQSQKTDSRQNQRVFVLPLPLRECELSLPHIFALPSLCCPKICPLPILLPLFSPHMSLLGDTEVGSSPTHPIESQMLEKTLKGHPTQPPTHVQKCTEKRVEGRGTSAALSPSLNPISIPPLVPQPTSPWTPPPLTPTSTSLRTENKPGVN